jgi:hypothetical protein
MLGRMDGGVNRWRCPRSSAQPFRAVRFVVRKVLAIVW